MTLAKAKIDPKENPAYASVKKTIQETVVKRVNAVAKENELNVREVIFLQIRVRNGAMWSLVMCVDL